MMACRVGGGRRARLDAELAKDGGDMPGDGVVTDEQVVGDLAIRLALDQQPQYLQLAWREAMTG